MSPGQGDLQYFELGAFPLASGFVLPAARLGYRCLGTLSPDHSNAVLLPHMYSGTSEFMTGFIGRGRPLDPERYFFILPDQFANGVSSSPSNTSAPFERAAFPPRTSRPLPGVSPEPAMSGSEACGDTSRCST